MDDKFLLAEIAKLYYIDQIKQKDIAKIFNITPIQVSRFLRSAIENNIIQFHITMPIEVDLDLGKKIKDKYKLRECVVIDEEDEGLIGIKIAQYTSKFVYSLLQDGAIMGVSWGKGIYEFVKQLPFGKLPDLKIVQLSGGFVSEKNYMVTPAHIVTIACEKLGGVPIFLNAPFFSPNQDTKNNLLKDEGILKVYELASKSSVNIIGASSLKKTSTVFRVGMVSTDDIAELSYMNAIGDIAGYFIDDKGDPIKWSKSELYNGVPLDLIGSAYTTLCIAGEAGKEKVIRAGLNKKYFNTLITGKKLARGLL
ncbi:sugar-binding transcriptional regulator [Parablautia muri]|uniref:Sugar-binding domain-containing protein n=1 Tax=Parablautia muri TaxID=2320879 RepID=A0A9X5GRL9_9FIRM|nr:sugar-binding domain-containing protein [Parablautia muri]NBJ92321.1 hypothetical protein [Parablautia muri]